MECRPWVGGGHWDCVTKASRYPVPCASEASARKPPQLLWLTAEYPGPLLNEHHCISSSSAYLLAILGAGI